MNAKHYDTLLGVYGGSEIIDAFEDLEKDNKLLKETLLDIVEDLNDAIVQYKDNRALEDNRKLIDTVESRSAAYMEYVKKLLGSMEDR